MMREHQDKQKKNKNKNKLVTPFKFPTSYRALSIEHRHLFVNLIHSDQIRSFDTHGKKNKRQLTHFIPRAITRIDADFWYSILDRFENHSRL